MVEGSSDAAVTWAYITQKGDFSWPYTLYKGIIVVQPYRILYRVAYWAQFQDILLVKAYFCILFGYIAGIGFPAIARLFLNKKQNLIERLIFVIGLYVFFKPTLALNNLMIDLPSCAYFVGSVHCVLC